MKFWSKLQSLIAATLAVGAVSVSLWLVDVSAASQQSPLETLDQIAEKAGSLDGFLSNTQIQDEYFLALAKYYGESRFQRQSFDIILQQLKDLVAAVPEAKERIWAKRTPRAPLVIETLEAPEGLQLNAQGWQKFHARWTDQLKSDSKAILALPTEEDRLNRVNAILKKLDQRMKSFEDGLNASNATRGVREARSREFYSTLRNHPVFKEVASYLLLDQIQSHSVTEYFRSQDPSMILCGLEELQNTHAPQGVVIPESLRALIKSAAPSPESVLANSEVFQLPKSVAGERTGSALKKQTWVLREPLRLLHTLWRGAPFKECLGGSCTHINETTARRWAVSLLQGAEVQNLERGDRYLGYVQSVPVRTEVERFAALEVAAPDMKKKVLARIQGETTYSSKSLFSAWYQNAVKYLPQGTKGYVIGASESFMNGEGYASIYSSAPFLNGKVIALADEIWPVDFDFEKKVVAASQNKEGLAKFYGGFWRMIFETRDLLADHVTLLSSGDMPEEALRSAKEARKVFQGPMEGKIRLLSALAYQEWSPEMKALLREERTNIFRAAEAYVPTAGRFLAMTNPSALYTLFKVEFSDPPTSEQFMTIAKDIQTIKSVRRNFGNVPYQIRRVFQEQIAPFVRSAPTLNDVLKIRPILREANNIELEVSFMSAALERAKSPTQFTAVLEANVDGKLSQQYKREYNNLIRESIPKLLRLDPPPTAADIAYLMRRNGKAFDLSNRELIAREGLRRSKNADEFVRIVSFYGMSPELPEEKELQDRLIRENIDQFLKSNPRRDEILAIDYLAPGAIEQHQSPNVHSADPGCMVQNLEQRL